MSRSGSVEEMIDPGSEHVLVVNSGPDAGRASGAVVQARRRPDLRPGATEVLTA